MFWLIAALIAVGFLVLQSSKKSKREAQKEIYADAIDVVAGPIGPELILEASIPLKPGASMSNAHAASLGRHVKTYLSHNPEEAKRFLQLLDGESPKEVLNYEMMLEHDQHFRTIILRATSFIMSKRNWEFGSAIDKERLNSLVRSLELHPSAYHLDDGQNCTLRQGSIPSMYDV
jgi:hypothetical protein